MKRAKAAKPNLISVECSQNHEELKAGQRCPTCTPAYHKAYQAKNRERINERMRAYLPEYRRKKRVSEITK